MDLPPARDVADIPSDFKGQPLGTLASVTVRIKEVLPDAEFSDPFWGTLSRQARRSNSRWAETIRYRVSPCACTRGQRTWGQRLSTEVDSARVDAPLLLLGLWYPARFGLRRWPDEFLTRSPRVIEEWSDGQDPDCQRRSGRLHPPVRHVEPRLNRLGQAGSDRADGDYAEKQNPHESLKPPQCPSRGAERRFHSREDAQAQHPNGQAQ